MEVELKSRSLIWFVERRR